MPACVPPHVIPPAGLQDGGSPCGFVDGKATDNFGIFQYIYDLFDSAKAPVIYTPGDNEWTDW